MTVGNPSFLHLVVAVTRVSLAQTLWRDTGGGPWGQALSSGGLGLRTLEGGTAGKGDHAPYLRMDQAGPEGQRITGRR